MRALLARFGVFLNGSKPQKKELYGLDNLEDDAIGYPPNPIGIPVVQTHVLINRMQEEVDKIRTEIGVSREVFDEYIYPVFDRFIKYADLLPASEYKHHATGGGLVAHSLDVAHRCMRAAQMTHFPVTVGSLTETQQSNVQWRVATVLSGLLHDGGKILADVQVHDGKAVFADRLIWDAQSGQTIHDWSADNGIERYFITWSRDRHMKHQNASLVVMERLIPAKTWSWLEKCYDGKQIHAMMLASVGKTNLSHPMPQIIAEADSQSTKADMFSRSSHITKEIKKIPLSELFCDLIKHYLLTEKWRVNEKSAYVWFIDEQLYIVWNNAVPELIEEMIGAGYMIPSSAEVLARLMIEEGQAIANGDELYFDVYPEILGDAKKPVKIRVIKIRNVQRVVLEPEKLYSLKEHSKRPTPTKVDAIEQDETKDDVLPNQNIIEEIFDDEELTASYSRSKSRYETSQATMVRVLKNIKGAMIERAKANRKIETPVKSITQEMPLSAYDDMPVYDEPDFDDEPTYGECSTQTLNSSSSHTQENVSQPVLNFESEIARFLLGNFEFEKKDNGIQVPSSSLIEIMIKAQTIGFDITIPDIMQSEEVHVYE